MAPTTMFTLTVAFAKKGFSPRPNAMPAVVHPARTKRRPPEGSHRPPRPDTQTLFIPAAKSARRPER